MIIGSAIIFLPKTHSLYIGDILVVLSAAIAPVGNYFQLDRKIAGNYMKMQLKNYVNVIILNLKDFKI